MSILWAARGLLEVIAAASQLTSTAAVGGDVDVATLLGSYSAGVGASGELRLTGGDGELLGGSVSVSGGVTRPELLVGDSLAIAPLRFEHTVEIGALPALSASRDLRRRPYDRVTTTIWFDFLHGTGGFSGGLLPMRLIAAHDVQIDDDRRFWRDDLRLDMSAYRGCRTPAHAPPRWCLSVFAIHVHNAFGERRVAGGYLAPLAVENVAIGDWALDALVGYGGGTLFIPGVPQEPSGPPYDDETCEDRGECVDVDTAVYQVRLRGPADAGALDVHAVRAVYPTMIGELAVEDRAELSARWAIGRTSVATRGFAAYTRWWTLDGDQLARLGDDVTGGGDLTASRPLRGWQLDLTAAAARSYHAGLDGGAPRAELAAQGTVSLRRDWHGER